MTMKKTDREPFNQSPGVTGVLRTLCKNCSVLQQPEQKGAFKYSTVVINVQVFAFFQFKGKQRKCRSIHLGRKNYYYRYRNSEESVHHLNELCNCWSEQLELLLRFVQLSRHTELQPPHHRSALYILSSAATTTTVVLRITCSYKRQYIVQGSSLHNLPIPRIHMQGK